MGARNEWVKYTKEEDSIPRNNLDAESTCSEFHPTCGDFTFAGKRSHSPANTPNPSVSGDSLLRSNIHCIPTQIPRNGATLPIASAISCCKPERPRLPVEAKWPTPGSTIFAAVATCFGSEVITFSSPSQSNAFLTDTRFPAP